MVGLWYITMILMFYSRLYNINLGFILSLKIQNVNLLILHCYTISVDFLFSYINESINLVHEY